MLPFHWRLGPLAVTPNELFTVLGAVLGGWIAARRLRALGSTKGGIVDFIMAALALGAVGARLYYFVPLWIRGVLPASQLFSTWADGSGFFGGFVGGSLGIALTARLKKMPVLPSLDAVLATVPLGFAVGKIGCLLAGCCYGRPTPSGVSFAPGSLCYVTQARAAQIAPGAARSLPVFPAQLVEMAFGFALFAGLWMLQKRSKRPGEVTAACFAAYSAYRFVIEFFRDDPDRRTFGSATLTDSQITGIVLFLVATAAWVWLRRKPPAETAPAAPK